MPWTLATTMRRKANFIALVALLAHAHSIAWAQELTGTFLVAGHSLADPNFGRSVVLIAQHGDEGTLGIIVNRRTRVALKEIFPGNKSLRASEQALHFGGPVSHRVLSFAFRSQDQPANALNVVDDVYLSQDVELLDKLLGRPQPAAELRVFAGYAGWAPGQLEAEIARGDWHVIAADAKTIFAADPDAIWPELIKRAGGRSVDAPMQRLIRGSLGQHPPRGGFGDALERP
jgi:putative transcriptional regulator